MDRKDIHREHDEQKERDSPRTQVVLFTAACVSDAPLRWLLRRPNDQGQPQTQVFSSRLCPFRIHCRSLLTVQLQSLVPNRNPVRNKGASCSLLPPRVPPPCLAPGPCQQGPQPVVIRVFSYTDILTRTTYAPTRKVILLFMRSFSLPQAIVMGANFSCTFLNVPTTSPITLTTTWYDGRLLVASLNLFHCTRIHHQSIP